MQSGSDRRAIGTLHGVKASDWPGKPVPISVPSNNNYSNRMQEPAPSSTKSTNPFNGPMTFPRRVGNSTSRSTLIRPVPSTASAPPSKRRKLDNHSSHLTGKNKDYPCIVSDDEIDSEEPNTSSTTRPPKYTDPSDKGRQLSRPRSSKHFSLAKDGDSYKEIVSKYSSDPIDQFPLDTTQDKGGSLVSNRIRQFENNGIYHERLPKVDFREKSLKSSMKTKSKANSTKPNTLVLRRVPVAPSLTNDTQPADKIPVHSFFSNEIQWQSSPHQQIWMYTRSRKLFFEDNSGKLKEYLVDDAYTMTLAEPSEVQTSSASIIQLKTVDLVKETITIRVHTKHSQWNMGTYIKFVDTLKNYVVETEFIRGSTDLLWKAAEQNASALKRKNSTSRLEELKEHRSKARQNNIDPSLSRQMATTSTALKRKSEPVVQAKLPNHQPRFELGPSEPTPILFPQRNLRSKTKAALDAEPVPSAPTNPDEVVLSYPAGLPGAVNITNADLERLNPGAFLNDTLIEFGLKVWLRDLEISNPELADQIHVFSSFFYKKFNSKKDVQGAYDSVRKWTNKFDIFRKRYIIVPINEHLHWYLAIIYEPEHVLEESPVNASRRPETRLSTARAIAEIDSNSSRIRQRDSLEIEELDQRSEVEVERDLSDFQNSCTIEDRGPRTPSPQQDDHSDIYEPLSASADVIMASPNRSPMVIECDTSTVVAPPRSAKGKRDTVEAANFYQPTSAQRQYGKRKKAQGTPKSTQVDNVRDEVEIVDNVPKTYIFTFDSLGNRHPQAVKKLSAYLKMEAKHKRGVDGTGIVVGKTAPVPFQTNFCDCGIYLLHFAQTFMSDATKYANIILTPRPKLGDAERKAIWHVDKDFEPKGRQQHRLRIEALSRDWKKLRGDTQKQSEVANHDDESEGEVELVESDTGKHPKSGRKSQLHGKKTGPASRVRG